MTKPTDSTILFLCTGNYYRSRFAEILFNASAAQSALTWRATSRGLAVERGAHNVGPMAKSAIAMLETMGLGNTADCARFPVQATAHDFETSARVIALKQAEHLPLSQERFPTWAQKVEFWHIDDAPGVLGLIEREVVELIEHLHGLHAP